MREGRAKLAWHMLRSLGRCGLLKLSLSKFGLYISASLTSRIDNTDSGYVRNEQVKSRDAIARE